MELTAEKLIDLLYKCADEHEIIELRKVLDVYDAPIITKDFKEDGYNSIVSDKENAEIFFTDISKFDKNIDKDMDCSVLFSGIDLWKNTHISLPFELKIGDNLDTVIKKIGKDYTYANKNFPRKTWPLKRNDGKDYLLTVTFSRDENSLNSIDISTYDNTINLLNNEFHIKNN